MNHNFKLGSFLCGMLSAALIIGCGATALAAAGGGSVSFGSVGLTINGKTALEKGAALTTDAGNKIPSSILYTDETGGGTTYLPLAAISRMLDIPVSWDGENGVVQLGAAPGKPEISFGGASADSIWEKKPLTQVGAKAGPYTEVEPVWPAKEQITSSFAREAYFSSDIGVSDTYYPLADRGLFSLSITNNSDCPLILSIMSSSTITTERIPSTIVPVGETVVRTFSIEEYTGYLNQKGLTFHLSFDPAVSGPRNQIKATVSAVSFQAE